MEKSDEVRRFLSALIETFGTSQMGPAFADAIAAEPGVLMVGTDPAEWWGDPDDLLRVVQVQSKELQGAAATAICPASGICAKPVVCRTFPP